MGREKKNVLEIERVRKAKHNLSILFNELERLYGWTQGDVARKMWAKKMDSDEKEASLEDIANIRSALTNYLSFKKENGDYKYTISIKKAQEICEAINKYPNVFPGHAGADFRWQWLAGIDDIPTYYEEYHGGYLKDLQDAEVLTRERWEESPRQLLAYALDQHGFELVSNIDPSSLIPGWYSSYDVRSDDGILFSLSPAEMSALEEELRSYASYLVTRELQRHNKSTQH